MDYFLNADSGHICIGGTPVYNGTSATVNIASMLMARGGEIYVPNTAALPGGGTITRLLPGEINAYGVGVAAGSVSATGASGSVQNRGITSITKTGTGVYEIKLQDSFVPYAAMATLALNYPGSINIGWTSAASALLVKTFNASGAAADAAFYIFVPK